MVLGIFDPVEERLSELFGGFGNARLRVVWHGLVSCV
jgi:hypothetical protein